MKLTFHESQPQNPEFRNNPENIHHELTIEKQQLTAHSSGLFSCRHKMFTCRVLVKSFLSGMTIRNTSLNFGFLISLVGVVSHDAEGFGNNAAFIQLQKKEVIKYIY